MQHEKNVGQANNKIVIKTRLSPRVVVGRKNSGTIPNFRGFTLIELLVVVLIIGILAAVALPQYQKATDKARYTQAVTLAEKIWQAEQRFFLANGQYTRDFDELDLDMPTPKSTLKDNEANNYYYTWGSCWLHVSNYTACRVKLGTDYAWYFAGYRTSERSCWAHPQTSKRANALCQAVTKNNAGTETQGYKKYLFLN